MSALVNLHNTLTRSKEPLHTECPDRVTMYVCPDGVYNYAHIGNARPAVVFDVLARVLRQHYDEVIYASNLPMWMTRSMLRRQPKACPSARLSLVRNKFRRLAVHAEDEAWLRQRKAWARPALTSVSIRSDASLDTLELRVKVV